MNIRLLAFDLDGTTLKNHGELSEANRAALLAAGEKGVYIVPSTGRLYSFLPESLMSLPCVRYMVLANGAIVYDRAEEKPLSMRLLSTEMSLRMMKIFDRFHVYYEFYDRGGAITVVNNEEWAMNELHFPERKRRFLRKAYTQKVENLKDYVQQNNVRPEKFNLLHVPEEIRPALVDAILAECDVEVSGSMPDNLEVNAAGVHKGEGLRLLCEKLGVSPEEVMVLGDSSNDLGMFRFAGVTVAMGNASDELKSISRFETADCIDDGAAKAIERFILHPQE